MYLGQATFYQDRMNEFLEVAKSLEIKEISKDVECDDDDEFKSQQNDNNRQVNNKIDIILETSINQSFVPEEIGTTYTEISGYMDASGQYKCRKCGKHFLNLSNLNKHSRTAHEGIRYPCKECNTTFTQNTER